LAYGISTAQGLARRVSEQRRWVVLAMLVALHLALSSTPGGAFQRVWLLVHFGFFLLWQPFIAKERELEPLGSVALFVVLAVTIYFVAGWTIVAWLLILLGILGGRVLTVRTGVKRNLFYLVAFAYLLAVLLVNAVPTLLLPGETIPDPVAQFARLFLPVMLAALVMMPFDPSGEESGQVFDFFYAVLVFQLGGVLVLGSIALMRYAGNHYFAAVALTMLGFGIALFVLAMLWNPMRGFGGLRTYFSRYLLSVGMPFEMWMRRVAELSEKEPGPARFLEQALAEIALLPWMNGARWMSPDGQGVVGETEGPATAFAYHELELVFHTRTALSPALFLHMRLLAQVLAEFHEGKRREAARRRDAYLQAVHETGARLTHDVKNLLQSLYALVAMAPREPTTGYEGLLQRQLPQLTKRLNATIEQLRSPEIEMRAIEVSARRWWSELERRLADSGVALEARIGADTPVPASVFDSFIENALDNARAKIESEGEAAIRIELDCDGSRVELSVCDAGSAVHDTIAARLFREPIERGAGLGIGLYNAARQATAAGYRLHLARNRAGDVCFTLSRDSAAREH